MHTFALFRTQKRNHTINYVCFEIFGRRLYAVFQLAVQDDEVVRIRRQLSDTDISDGKSHTVGLEVQGDVLVVSTWMHFKWRSPTLIK